MGNLLSDPHTPIFNDFVYEIKAQVRRAPLGERQRKLTAIRLDPKVADLIRAPSAKKTLSSVRHSRPGRWASLVDYFFYLTS
jgi:hypothetical protein